MLIAFSPTRDATMKTYKQLTYGQRCQISALKKIGMSQNKIAEQLNISQSTVSRELFRNTGKKGYRIKQVQLLTDNRRSDSHKNLKMTESMIMLIKTKLQLKSSPEQISGWLREEHSLSISYETIYLHIWTDKRRGGFIKNRVSIDVRPSIVDEKSRVGDWEID